MCCSLFFITACGINKSEVQAVVEIQEEPAAEDQSEYEESILVTDMEMKEFFEDYLSIDEESMLVLNQKPQKVNDEYWEAYRAYHSKTNEMLEKYLSEDVKRNLKNQYIHDDFQYFRFVEVNDYMITGIAEVEDALIASKVFKEGKDLYEVVVTAQADVIDLDLANKIYQWNENVGYYAKNQEAYVKIAKEIEESLDQIKVNLHYWVEIPKGDSFVIDSVKEKSNISFGLEHQVSAKNNYFVSRIPYKEEVVVREREKINQYMDSFLKREYNFYNYYRQAYDTDYETLRVVFENDLGLRNIVNIDEDTYRENFNILTIPLKDDMELLGFDFKEDINVVPHMSSSQKYPAYEVQVKTDVKFLNGDIIPYEYTYLFRFENGMISAVRYIAQKEDLLVDET